VRLVSLIVLSSKDNGLDVVRPEALPSVHAGADWPSGAACFRLLLTAVVVQPSRNTHMLIRANAIQIVRRVCSVARSNVCRSWALGILRMEFKSQGCQQSNIAKYLFVICLPSSNTVKQISLLKQVKYIQSNIRVSCQIFEHIWRGSVLPSGVGFSLMPLISINTLRNSSTTTTQLKKFSTSRILNLTLRN